MWPNIFKSVATLKLRGGWDRHISKKSMKLARIVPQSGLMTEIHTENRSISWDLLLRWMICRIVGPPPNGICSSASLESCTSRKAPPAVCNLWPPVEHLQHFNSLNIFIIFNIFIISINVVARRLENRLHHSREILSQPLLSWIAQNTLEVGIICIISCVALKIQNTKFKIQTYKHTLEVGIICTIYCAALECGLLKSWKVVHTVHTVHTTQCLKGREL